MIFEIAKILSLPTVKRPTHVNDLFDFTDAELLEFVQNAGRVDDSAWLPTCARSETSEKNSSLQGLFSSLSLVLQHDD